MDNGIIVVLDSFDSSKLKKDYISSLKEMKEVRICFVCNSSEEELLESLTDIAYTCENADVVNANRKKLNTSSVRYGARFMYKNYNLKYLGFIVGKVDFQVLELLKDYAMYKQQIIELQEKIKRNKGIKLTYYQSLFSVVEYLENIMTNSLEDKLKVDSPYNYNYNL